MKPPPPPAPAAPAPPRILTARVEYDDGFLANGLSAAEEDMRREARAANLAVVSVKRGKVEMVRPSTKTGEPHRLAITLTATLGPVPPMVFVGMRRDGNLYLAERLEIDARGAILSRKPIHVPDLRSITWGKMLTVLEDESP